MGVLTKIFGSAVIKKTKKSKHLKGDKIMPWFRLYTEMIDDPKLKLLAFEDRWHFISILCCKGQGMLEGDFDLLKQRKISVKLGVQLKELNEIKRRMMEVELVDDCFNPIAWNKRQFRSDKDMTNAERQRRYRENRDKEHLEPLRKNNDALRSECNEKKLTNAERQKRYRENIKISNSNALQNRYYTGSNALLTDKNTKVTDRNGKVTGTDTDTETDTETETEVCLLKEKDLLKDTDKTTPPTPPGGDVLSNGSLAGFKEFLKIYPKKKSMGEAKQVWLKLEPSSGLQEKILRCVEKCKESEDWVKEAGRYVPRPANFLKAEPWLDGGQDAEDLDFEAWLETDDD